jgi:hypothetical protein
LGACQSEKQELELARSLCDSGSITKIIVRLLSARVEQKRNWLGRKLLCNTGNLWRRSCLSSFGISSKLIGRGGK